MIFITRTQKSVLAVLIIILVVISGTIYTRQEKATEISLGKAVVLKETTPAPELIQAAEEPAEISVYICGFVNSPGVIKIKEGARLDEAIKMAGGAAAEADLTAVNLAYKLADEDMIYIPEKGEKPSAESRAMPGVSTVKSAARLNTGKININTAGESELDTLPGVGPSTARAIIRHRNDNGPFLAIEDIKQVKGIGDAKFDSIKDGITVE